MKKIYILGLSLVIGITLNAQELTINELGQKLTLSESSDPGSVQRLDEDDILWDQPVSTADNQYATVSTYYIPEDYGVYSADDFEVGENGIQINAIYFSGSQSNDDAQDLIQAVNLYFYEDDSGMPSGSPVEQGAEFLKYSFDYADFEVTPGEMPFLGHKNYYLDILEAAGEGIELEEGHYWLSIVFDIDMDPGDFDDRFSWKDSLEENLELPKMIAPEIGIPNWTDTPDVGFNAVGMAFTLYGEEGEVMSTSSVDLNQIKIYPNPARDVIYLAEAGVKQVKNITATNTVGQTFLLNYTHGRINISNLTSGVYVLQIQTSEGNINRKLIKK